MRGTGRRPARAATLAVAVTVFGALMLVTLPKPPTRPAVARSGDPAAACQDLRAGAAVACLHGNDTPPPGVSLFERPTLQELEARSSLDSSAPRLRGLAALEQATDSSAAGAPPALTCIGNGSSGNRIQAVYAHASTVADRYAVVLGSLRQWAAEIDQAVWVSAGQTGGGRRLRFVTDAVGGSCVLDVIHVVLSPTGDDSFGQMRTELQAKGLNRTDRKYLVWVDAANGICGLGEVYDDQRPGPENYNNGGPMYARVDTPCWQYAELHEIFHTLGAVQPDTPHPSASLHCTDEADVMCYDDDQGGPVTMTSVCPPDQEALLDCGDDDYFNTDPPAGSYLAGAWNTADSSFLQADNAPRPAQVSLSRAVTITYGARAGLRGRLTDEETGAAVSAEPVNLFARRAGQAGERAVASTTSAADGTVRFGAAPGGTTVYRASFPGSTTYGIARSAGVTVAVRTRVTARRSATGIGFGQSVTFSGTVAPNHHGQRIYLQRRLRSGRWATVTSAILSSASGYRVTLRPPVKGRLAYRVLKPADRDHRIGTSPVLTITVR
jgi:hypothetical protein